MQTAEILKEEYKEYNRLGSTALNGAGIEFSELGVNDYATHLDQYLRHGEEALEYIEEDLITDSAERMVKSKYINRVVFRLYGNDFLSEKGNFSMRKITSNTQDRMQANHADWQLKKRTEIESNEVDKLNDWFGDASTDEVFVVDSLPISEDEEYAVKRIYHKLDNSNLSMHVVILHSPSVPVFNAYHKKIGANIPPSVNALGVLENSYVLQIPHGMDIDGFIQVDVDRYDETLAERNPGQEFVFGIAEGGIKDIPNSNDVIRRQKPLLGIYKDTIRALGQSDWAVTPEIINIDKKLGLNLNFREGQNLNLDNSRALLDGVHQYIMSTLNNAPQATLEMLAAVGEYDSQAAYGVASYYGGEAKDAGIRYESSACPTVLNIESATELSTLQRAHRLNTDPTKCVLCRACRKVVDLPKELYKKKILHCVECKTSVHREGGRVDPRDIEKYYGKNKLKTSSLKNETQWQKIKREEREKKDRQMRQRQIDERAKKEEEMRLQLEPGSRFTRAA